MSDKDLKISFKSGATITGSFSDKNPRIGCELSFVDEFSSICPQEESLELMFDRLKAALQTGITEVPSGLTREEKRQLILAVSSAGKRDLKEIDYE